jgi:hypothetical protein
MTVVDGAGGAGCQGSGVGAVQPSHKILER